ncbi:MAG: hypothetical protein B6D41_03850 [Chloroflexi bacterium UTCFX4]|nr:MAG: hypothetical protein B6D41_03850 [Chloroflexi bacterium UTCFX4]
MSKARESLPVVEIMSEPIVPRHSTPPQIITIERIHGWTALHLQEIWESRDLLYYMTARDIKTRYRQTALGPLWIVLQPLANMFFFTILFGLVAKLPSEGIPYPVFSYAALLPWTVFAECLQNTSASLFLNKDLMKKVYFPHLLIPLSKVLGSLIDFTVSLGVLLLMMAFYRLTPTWNIIWLPLFLLIAVVTGIGVGLWLAGILVRYRDVGQLVNMGTRIWMALTPIAYSITLIPSEWQAVYSLNPMTGVVQGFRWAMLGTPPPLIEPLAVSSLALILIFIGGIYVFRRTERSIVDIA